MNSTGLRERQFINWLAIYTYVGYGIAQICYFSMCRPFGDYFVVPPPPGQGKSLLVLLFDKLNIC
jgi:hypothetical protein